ncbi:hypothetical protein BK635_25980 [Pseudomonas chlororaphis]|uniref:hypothetical protein n=1 Tax=Pseudomonas chlororaphis TaxID=587753 RepID=UPI000FF6BD4F|nr:hypothetical protein [Pseudomonas chlororaphis]RON75543.1 hypothetical protein BK635_25980 [Pseudomonas chlororaphis]
MSDRTQLRVSVPDWAGGLRAQPLPGGHPKLGQKLLVLAPAALAAALLVLRTSWEDRLLQAELPGYADYCQWVRWRLVPGLW